MARGPRSLSDPVVLHNGRTMPLVGLGTGPSPNPRTNPLNADFRVTWDPNGTP